MIKNHHFINEILNSRINHFIFIKWFFFYQNYALRFFLKNINLNSQIYNIFKYLIIKFDNSVYHVVLKIFLINFIHKF